MSTESTLCVPMKYKIRTQSHARREIHMFGPFNGADGAQIWNRTPHTVFNKQNINEKKKKPKHCFHITLYVH